MYPVHQFPDSDPTPIELPGFPGANLAMLSPQEVVALSEYAATTNARDLRGLEGTLSTVLKILPERHLQFGRAIFSALSECPDDHHRGHVSLWISSLARADRSTGVELWDRLLRDTDDEVRYKAYERLSEPLMELAAEGGGYPSIHQKLADHGLTWRDALRLEVSYVGARHGEDLVHIAPPEGYDMNAYLARLHSEGRIAYLKLFQDSEIGH